MTMEIKRIEHYWRAPSSVNSNPAFWVLFEGDERPTRTMSDAGFGYAVGIPTCVTVAPSRSSSPVPAASAI